MPQNVEVKARVHNIDVLLQKATELCQMEAEVIEQSDTFFKVKNGRLKLRQFKVFSSECCKYGNKYLKTFFFQEGTGGELIFYERSNNCGPKVSTYMKSLVNDPLSLKQVLSMALEVEGNISKKRMLFYHNQTRIHIDKVCNLGDFLELEACNAFQNKFYLLNKVFVAIVGGSRRWTMSREWNEYS